jgi:hypothetical protein
MGRASRFWTLRIPLGAVIAGGALFVASAFVFPGFSNARMGGASALVTGVAAGLGLADVALRFVHRDGIRNGGFEECVEADRNLTGWASSSTIEAVRTFREPASGSVLAPTEGTCMAVISTIAGLRATLLQRFVVPAGARTLNFDFQIVGARSGDWEGSVLEVSVITPAGDDRSIRVGADTYESYPSVSRCPVTRGDDPCVLTGWRTATLETSAFSLLEVPVSVTLAFALSAGGQAKGATHVLIDNVRFGTIWVDAKILEGSNADVDRVKAEVRQATRVLSQAGLNVRLRRVRTIRDAGSLLDPDINWNLGEVSCREISQQPGRLTAEENHVLKLARSTVSTDINVYYVRAGRRTIDGVPNTVVPLAGYALGPDEYCHDVKADTNAGVFMMDLAAPRPGVLAHEIGHLLLSPASGLSALEHGVANRLNFMVGFNTPSRGVISREQSVNINRRHAPFVSP